MVALDPSLDPGLLQEGLARELVNRIQRLRKESGLEITDRIALGIYGGREVQDSAHAFREFITGETLAMEFLVGERVEVEGFREVREVELAGHEAVIALSPRLDVRTGTRARDHDVPA